MLVPEDVESLRAELARVNPATVVAFAGDAELRRVPVPQTKKRWQSVLQVVERLGDFTRLELLDRRGGVLGVWDAPVESGPDERTPTNAADERMLRLLITAQKAAMEGYARHVETILAGSARANEVMVQAVEQLALVQRATLEAQGQAYAARLQGIAGEETGELQAMKLLEILGPIMMGRLPGPAAKPSKEKSDA